jgi:hypothetical protein
MKLRVGIIVTLLIMNVVTLAAPSAAQETQTSIWQAADNLRSALLDAQRALFAAERSDDSAAHYEAALGHIDAAFTIYTQFLQPTLQRHAVQQDESIRAALAAAQEAAQTGDAVLLALARGMLWTSLLHASYTTTLNALSAVDHKTANAWLSLREYRQATRGTVILSQAARASGLARGASAAG